MRFKALGASTPAAPLFVAEKDPLFGTENHGTVSQRLSSS
jgi:hypothetical protein